MSRIRAGVRLPTLLFPKHLALVMEGHDPAVPVGVVHHDLAHGDRVITPRAHRARTGSRAHAGDRVTRRQSDARGQLARQSAPAKLGADESPPPVPLGDGSPDRGGGGLAHMARHRATAMPVGSRGFGSDRARLRGPGGGSGPTRHPQATKTGRPGTPWAPRPGPCPSARAWSRGPHDAASYDPPRPNAGRRIQPRDHRPATCVRQDPAPGSAGRAPRGRSCGPAAA